MNRSRHLLFAMWEGGGAVPPVLGLARRLIERGHTVSVLGDPTIREEAQSAGCAFTPWRSAPHRTTLSPEHDLMKDWEATNPLEMMRRLRDVFIAGPAARYAADTLEAIERSRPDALVSDYFLFGALIAAERASIPRVAVVPNIWPLPTAGAPAFGPGFQPARGALGRLRDRLMNAVAMHLFDRALPSLNETRRQLGLAPSRAFFDPCLASEAVLVLTSAAFDFSSASVPRNVHYVGPVLDDPEWAQPWIAPWPADNRDPIVLVAFSSTFQDQGVVLRRVVDALATLPVRAIVTLGEMLADEEVQSKGAVVVVRSARHRDILPHAALVVTHCGHGTTLKALAAGVPMVCMPMGRDQNDTAARVVHAGAGVRLQPSASVREIRAATARVLEDERYRLAARRMGEKIEAEQESVDLLGPIEAVARAS